MLRAVLLGVLTLVALPACDSKSTAPAVQPGAVAGKVLEVSGSVRAGTRALAVGDTVEANETIETGADGEVVIELAHNQARWELGPNRKVKPRESAAWTAARHEGSAGQVDQDTSAAGRPAERSAADTATTAAPASAPGAPAEPLQAVAPLAQVAPPSPTPRGRAATTGDGAQPEAEKAEKADKAAPGHGAKAMVGSRGTGAGAPPPPPPSGDVVADSGGAPPSSGSASNPLQRLAVCLPAGAHVRLRVHVARHVPAVTFVNPVDAKVKTCITNAARKLSLVVASGELELTLTR